MHVLNLIATIVIVLCWPLYLSLFFRGSGRPKQVQTRDLRSVIGISLQFLGAAVMWFPRPFFTPLVTSVPALIVLPSVAMLLAIGAVAFSRVALNTLGANWSLVAQVGGSHRLVREGIYGVVRHPLYVCFFGLTVATGIVWTELPILIAGIASFVAGVWIRVRAEEQLLRKYFGSEFEDYVRQVPAFIPNLHVGGVAGNEK